MVSQWSLILTLRGWRRVGPERGRAVDSRGDAAGRGRHGHEEGRVAWDVLSGMSLPLAMFHDNTAVREIIKTGKNPNMRHIARHHGINPARDPWAFKQPAGHRP